MNKFEPKKEKEFLNTLASDYKDQAAYSEIKKDIIFKSIYKYTENEKEKTVLQMGCSNGYETDILAKKFFQVDVVDGSSDFISKLIDSNEYKNINFIYSLFEEYSLPRGHNKYDYIFCNYVLEHVFDPVLVLKNIKKLLKKDGLVFSVVPNSMAFSRQLAKKMGMIENLKALTDNDRDHGHRRVYDINDIEKDFISSGYKIIETNGIIFKILADFQLNDMIKLGIIERKHIHALHEMSSCIPNFCDSILVIAKQ